MKHESAIPLSIAAIALALLLPAQFSRAQAMTASMNNSPAAMNKTDPPPGLHEAMAMVPAQAALVRTLDARKARQGEHFQVALSDTVHLKNGLELPQGTRLIGTVATDHMQAGGASRLALSITQAKLRGGKVVPIKATIVGVYAPAETDDNGYPVDPGNQEPNFWNAKTLQVDQIGGPDGIELHSKIAGMNSGALVSHKKEDIKLRAGSELALAIAARNNS